jgi:exopolyphosphatase/guanosine-5'-triphosphate,3'-diphosphate pyrophosphatase
MTAGTPAAVGGRVSVIDLGSNAVRLAVLERTRDGLLDLAHWERRGVRLIEGMDGCGGFLQPVPMARTVAALADLVASSRALGLEPVAVATSAVRDARNQAEFVGCAQTSAGVRLRVLSGEEEAYYAYLAVAASLPLADALIVEVGGGSVQLIEMVGRAFARWSSLPLGAVRMIERHPMGDPPRPDQLAALRGALEEGLAPLAGWSTLSRAETRSPVALVGIGGAVRDATRLHLAGVGAASRETAAAGDTREEMSERGAPDIRAPGPLDAHDRPTSALLAAHDPPLPHGYPLPRDALAGIREWLVSLDLAERIECAGLPPDRADVIVAAVELLDVLADRTRCASIVTSLYGIREGIAYESLGVSV